MCGRKCGRKLIHRLFMMLMDHQHCCCHPADSDDGDDCRTNLFDDGRCESIAKAPNNPPICRVTSSWWVGRIIHDYIGP